MAPGGLDASVLRTIPLELLLRITDFLSTTELCEFRLSCRAIHGSLATSFTKEFFVRKQFMISIFSLNTLVEISQSHLSSHLRYLHIGLDQVAYPEHDSIDFITNPVELEQRRRYNEFLAAERVAAAVGYHRELLAIALGNLPNLESIIIRDHNSKLRTRDGENFEWKSYGHETLIKTMGVRPKFPGTGASIPRMTDASDALAQILFACAQSGARPQAIEVITQRTPIRGHGFVVPPSIMHKSAIALIENLTKLHLNLRPTRRSDGGPRLSERNFDDSGVPTADTFRGIQGHDHLLYRFLYIAKNITDLRVNQAQVPPSSASNNPTHYLLEWLASAASLSPHILPKLQHLSLGRFSVTAELLQRLILAFSKRLKSLELWRITLWLVLPRLVHQTTWPKIKFWPSFLHDLRRTPDLDLHHLKFALMGQNYLVTSNPVSFGQICAVGIAGMENLEYTGPDWRRYIEEKEDEIEVAWEEAYQEPDDDSQGNGQDSDENLDSDDLMGDN